jgi:hypothetical protein
MESIPHHRKKHGIDSITLKAIPIKHKKIELSHSNNPILVE